MILARDDETIIAQCTPSGKGAIALLRLSGADVRKIVAKFATVGTNKKIEELPSGSVHYGWIIDDHKNHIDQVMLIIMDGPKTFTGENTIEITCHNNPFLIESIIAQAIKNGARVAHEGEFTKRAFLNGKIDLLQAEAINDLIHANTQLALKKSLSQLEGSFSHWMAQIERDLVKALAWCEASFEFLDEEAEFGYKIKEHLGGLTERIKVCRRTFDAQQQIRHGIKIALIGSVNTGKSSLFNALLNQNRAIVTEIAGTTRDVIEAGVYRNGNYWTLIDTAGLRDTANKIEKEGIKRSSEEATKADIILLVFDGSRNFTDDESTIYQNLLEQFGHKIIIVENKLDLSAYPGHILGQKNSIKVSSLNKKNIDILENLIEQKISTLFSDLESPFLLNKRQHTLLIGLESKINDIIIMLTGKIEYELVSYHIKDALEYMTELTGKSISEAGLDMVFKEFCVGK